MVFVYPTNSNAYSKATLFKRTPTKIAFAHVINLTYLINQNLGSMEEEHFKDREMAFSK